MTPSDLVREFQKVVMAETGVTVSWAQNDKPLTGEQLERIGRKAEWLFCCQHTQTDYDAQRNEDICRDCGAHLACENAEDSAFAALEAARKS